LLNLETDFLRCQHWSVFRGCLAQLLVGIASLQVGNSNGDQTATSLMANSLYKYTWDGTSFRRRAWSGNWNHNHNSSTLSPYQAVNDDYYYRQSSEHRCVQHGMALAFWSMLVRHSKQHETAVTMHRLQQRPLPRRLSRNSRLRWWDVAAASFGQRGHDEERQFQLLRR
jgi:hypothetical protein